MAPAVKMIDTPCPANANAADTFPCRPNHKRIYANATIMTVNMAAIQNQRILRRLHGVVSPRNRFKPCTVLPPCHYCTASRERLVIYEDVRARESLGIRTPLGVSAVLSLGTPFLAVRDATALALSPSAPSADIPRSGTPSPKSSSGAAGR